jgi:hypothetical protein
MTDYIDFERLESIEPDDFKSTRPYPYANPHGLLTERGYRELLDTLPGLDVFDEKFGKARLGGQDPHDRYSLEYAPDTPVSPQWKAFIGELCSDRYRDALARLLDAKRIRFRFHWHYTPRGRDVSPHTDAAREYGSHLFYFNDESDWDPAWGGETLVLDDGGRLDFRSAPALEEFENEIVCRSSGNYSAIMKRNDHAWHAVRPIECPEDRLRRIFIVVATPDTLYWRTRDRIVGKKAHFF